MPTAPTTMRAVIQDAYGAPSRVLRLGQIQRPSIKPGTVLIRVRATSVNTPDWAAITGVPYIFRLGIGLRRPRLSIRGSDLAGVVVAVDKSVTDLTPGDEVFGSTGTLGGAFAEYAVVSRARLAKKPAGLSFEEAAASVMTGLTALVAMRDVAKVGPGTRLLINGASGGVGTMALQIAKALGARITGVCSTRNLELVRSLGADEVVDYTTEDVTRSPRRFDVILDNVLNHPPTAMARLLAPRGVLIPNSLGYTGGLLAGLPRMARAVIMSLGSTTVKTVTPKVNGENLSALLRLLESGQIRTVIEKIYPLDDAASAVSHVLGHHPGGKIAITV
jgi:NADPH:quinone reductase-like Zn-dependent oxidoreductase